jgi:hypothetical protein
MKALLIPAFILLLAAYCTATNVSGPVSGVWEPSGNPYVLVDSTWVPYGSTLVVAPGVEIIGVGTNTTLNAYGKLIACGTPGDSIKIHCDGNAPFYLCLYGSDMDADIVVFVDLIGGFIMSGGDHYIANTRIFCHENSDSWTIGIDGPATNVMVRDCLFDLQNIQSWPFLGNGVYGISNVSGTFYSNILSLYAANGLAGYDISLAYADAFWNCQGEYLNNHSRCSTSASASLIGSTSQPIGFEECSGSARHNFVYACAYGSGRNPIGANFLSGSCINNTIILQNGMGTGIANPDTAINNIIQGVNLINGVGINNAQCVRYNTLWGLTNYFANLSPDSFGNRVEDPGFSLTTGELDSNSLCINSGSLDWSLFDPDGTRSDRGWKPYDPGQGPNYCPPQNYNEILFGLVGLGDYQDMAVTFTNIGFSPGYIATAIISHPAYSLLTPLPTDPVAPGDSLTLSLRFAPLQADTFDHQTITFFGNIPPYTIDLNGTGIATGFVEPPSPEPHSFALLQNHPNPFNASTVASYELRAASFVNLKVYDTAGREVATLAEGWKNAGRHEVTFEGSGLASGIYLARLQAGEFTQTQKLVLLK